jgi:hypothetical protein
MKVNRSTCSCYKVIKYGIQLFHDWSTSITIHIREQFGKLSSNKIVYEDLNKI